MCLVAAGERVAAPTLLRLCFGTAPAEGAEALGVPLTPLLGTRDDECWIARAPPRQGRDGLVHYREDGTHLAGWIWLDGARAQDMEAAGEAAYRALRAFLPNSGYAHLLRTWNYFHDITAGSGDDQRYRRFCEGRHRALAAPGFERQLPAATVIGTRMPGYLLYFLAAREPGEQVENPRQVSAFRYPRAYGRRSPSFSRAVRCGNRLLVSGTAAIVGHESRHANDIEGQLPEMLENIAALLRAAGHGWLPELLKLYVPHAPLAESAAKQVRAAFGTGAALLVLQGDVCRSELRVELEGLWRAAGDEHPGG